MSGTFFIRMKGECFFYEFRFHGLNFPSIGPATQMNAVKWEPSTENMYACDRDGVLKGDVKLTVAWWRLPLPMSSEVLQSKVFMRLGIFGDKE